MFAYSKIDTFLSYSFMQQWIVFFHIDLFLSKEKVIFVVGNHSILSFRLKLLSPSNPDLLVHSMYGKYVILKNFENTSAFILANIPWTIQFLIPKWRLQRFDKTWVKNRSTGLYIVYKNEILSTSLAQILRVNLKKMNFIDCYETSN